MTTGGPESLVASFFDRYQIAIDSVARIKELWVINERFMVLVESIYLQIS